MVRHTLNYRDMVDVVSALMEFSSRENQEGRYTGEKVDHWETKEISGNIDQTSVKVTNQLDFCFLLSIASR